MNWFRKFMQGRYGLDELSNVIIGVAVIIAFMGAITNLKVLSVLANGLVIYFIFRVLSKNVHRRFLENEYAVQRIITPVKKRFLSSKRYLIGSKEFKYFKCPNCKQELRVPRAKGKITITCPKCHNKFDKKS